MHVNEVLEILDKMQFYLKKVNKSSDEFEYDFDNVEDRFKNNMAQKIARHMDELYYLAEWLAKPIVSEGRLVKNDLGRYEIEGTDYYFTSGSTIEIWDEEDESYVKTRLEHTNGDYYAYAFGPQVKLEGLRARTRR
jgi:YHS domain-containing protein